MNNTYIADGIGLITLAAVVLMGSYSVPVEQISEVAWLFIYLMAAFSALFVWHHPKAPKQPRQWLLYSLYSVVAALLWVAYSRYGSSLLFESSEPTSSKYLDYAIAVIISPGLTIVALVGWMRSFAVRHQ